MNKFNSCFVYSLVRTKIEMHFIGPVYTIAIDIYTQELSIHCVSCGQIQVLYFCDGWIYNPVGP